MWIRQRFLSKTTVAALPSQSNVFSLSPMVKRALAMFRTAYYLGSVAILFAAAGCSMCCHPYDHSGPVFSADGCQATHRRAGSILDGASQPSPELARNQIHDNSSSPVLAQASQARRTRPQVQAAPLSEVAAEPQGPSLGQPQPGVVPGSERVVSVTDRLARPSANSSEAVEQSPSQPSQPMPESGWTARRPTTEILR